MVEAPTDSISCDCYSIFINLENQRHLDSTGWLHNIGYVMLSSSYFWILITLQQTTNTPLGCSSAHILFICIPHNSEMIRDAEFWWIMWWDTSIYSRWDWGPQQNIVRLSVRGDGMVLAKIIVVLKGLGLVFASTILGTQKKKCG